MSAAGVTAVSRLAAQSIYHFSMIIDFSFLSYYPPDECGSVRLLLCLWGLARMAAKECVSSVFYWAGFLSFIQLFCSYGRRFRAERSTMQPRVTSRPHQQGEEHLGEAGGAHRVAPDPDDCAGSFPRAIHVTKRLDVCRAVPRPDFSPGLSSGCRSDDQLQSGFPHSLADPFLRTAG